MKSRKVILKIFGVLMILGGLVRLFAGEQLFALAGISALWSDHPYFLYIYKVLGGFVILSGATILIISVDIARFLPLIKAWGFLFIVVGAVMTWSGASLGLLLPWYLPDILFSFLTATILLLSAYRIEVRR